MSDIFVSYAGADRARVAPLVRALEEEGLQLWWDRDIDYGENFHRVIEEALSAARSVIADVGAIRLYGSTEGSAR